MAEAPSRIHPGDLSLSRVLPVDRIACIMERAVIVDVDILTRLTQVTKSSARPTYVS